MGKKDALPTDLSVAGVGRDIEHDLFDVGRVEGAGGDVGEALERADEVIERLGSPKSGPVQ